MRGAMPKTARFTLFWSAEQDFYQLYEHGHLLLEADGASWFTWLTPHPTGKRLIPSISVGKP